MAELPHTCCYCGKQHKRGAKTFDVAGTRCVRREGCLTRPTRIIQEKPHGVCYTCGSKLAKGRNRCANLDTCRGRVLKSLRVIKHDDRTIIKWYEAAIEPQRRRESDYDYREAVAA